MIVTVQTAGSGDIQRTPVVLIHSTYMMAAAVHMDLHFEMSAFSNCSISSSNQFQTYPEWDVRLSDILFQSCTSFTSTDGILTSIRVIRDVQACEYARSVKEAAAARHS